MERTPKVCHISTVHSPFDTRIYYKEITSLTKYGYNVDYIVKQDKFVKNSLKNVTFYDLDPKNSIFTRIKNNVRALIIAIRLKDDIYHFHDPELIILGLILKLLFRKIVIFDIHELMFDELLHKPYLKHKLFAKTLANFYWLIENFSTKYFDMNILAEKNYQIYFADKKHVVIQNYLPLSYLEKANSNVTQKDSIINFVYVGSITKVRGIFEMISFFSMIKTQLNFNFHLIGPFHPSELEDTIKDLVKKNNIGDRVYIYGKLPFPEAQKVVHKCDVGLIFLHAILNQSTALPTKLFEYMGKGLAVIMADYEILVNFNEKHNCGLSINIFNLENEKAKILSFLNDRQKLNEIKNNNIEIVKNNYVWEIEERKLIHIYKNIIKS